MTTTTLPAFPTATLLIKVGPDPTDPSVSITIPVEPINQFLAIAPGAYFTGVHDENGSTYEPRLSNQFQILHLPTGRQLPYRACIACCRRAAAELVAMDIDWDTQEFGAAFTQHLAPDAMAAITAVVTRMYGCTSEACDEGEAF